MLNLRESSQAEIFSRVKESFPLFHLSPPSSSSHSPFLSSTVSHYRLHYCSTQQVWHLLPPAWPAILTRCLHQLVSCVGKGSPICLGCCQLLEMRRHPSNVIKSLQKNLKVPGSWKGVYNITKNFKIVYFCVWKWYFFNLHLKQLLKKLLFKLKKNIFTY